MLCFCCLHEVIKIIVPFVICFLKIDDIFKKKSISEGSFHKVNVIHI